MFDDAQEEIEQKLEQWVVFKEYITIEFDLKEGTAKVISNE